MFCKKERLFSRDVKSAKISYFLIVTSFAKICDTNIINTFRLKQS